MGKVIVTEFLSLDGVMEEPAWSLAYWNDEIARFKYDELFSCGAHLLGRVTYEGFASAWPNRKDEQGFADRMNNLPKYVVSTTMENASWENSTIIKENVADEIAKLKQQTDLDFLVAGSSILVKTLVENDLVDEYHLLIYPVVLGIGKKLFGDDCKTSLKLIESKPFSSGVVLLRYEPEKLAL